MNLFIQICGLPLLATAFIVAGFFVLGMIVDPEGMDIFFKSFFKEKTDE